MLELLSVLSGFVVGLCSTAAAEVGVLDRLERAANESAASRRPWTLSDKYERHGRRLARVKIN